MVREWGAGLIGRSKECKLLEELLAGVRIRQSGVVVACGEAGVGKSALLEHATRSASGFQVMRAIGVESEMELPFAALHQLCAPMLDRLPLLPEPQRDALAMALGLAPGRAPDRLWLAWRGAQSSL
jgi:sulfur carrier protein ThiS